MSLLYVIICNYMSLFVTICHYFSPDRINYKEFQDCKKKCDPQTLRQTDWVTDRTGPWEACTFKKERLLNTSLAAPGALAHRLQRRTICKIQNGCQWASKWPTWSGKVCTLRFLGVLSNFCKISFLIRALLLWEK